MTDNYLRAIHVTRVIDGDTIVADVDLGYHTTLTKVTYRVARVDAPEMTGATRQAGIEARSFTATWLIAHEKAGIYATSTKTDNWRRYIAEITCGDGHNLSDALLASGNAVIYK